jgi:hypothetical protein
MSGLNQIQIGFENLLKNGFEKLEKEKKGNSFLLGPFSLPQPISPACCGGPFPPSPLLRSASALGPSRGRRPS